MEVINAIKRHSCWLFPHVLQEILKLFPPLAHLDSNGPIGVITLILWE